METDTTVVSQSAGEYLGTLELEEVCTDRGEKNTIAVSRLDEDIRTRGSACLTRSNGAKIILAANDEMVCECTSVHFDTVKGEFYFTLYRCDADRCGYLTFTLEEMWQHDFKLAFL